MQSATCCAGWRVWGLLLAISLGCGCFLAAASAQDKKDEKKEVAIRKDPFRFATGDGVNLVGDFYYPEANSKTAPTIILLHAVGPGKAAASRKDFGKLPEQLAKQEFAVLTFDFRGYGDSKEVSNVYERMYGKKGNKLEAKNFSTQEDYAHLVSDVIAAKVWLDGQNNNGMCNANNVAVIGAEQGAMVGLLWVANEFVDMDRGRDFAKRKLPDQVVSGGPMYNPVMWGFTYMGPQVVPGKEVDVATKYEGDDVTCVIALSMRPSLGGAPEDKHLRNWLSMPLSDNRTILEKVGIYGIVGEKDTEADRFWTKATKDWLKGSGLKQQTGFKSIKNTNLTGTKLLGSDVLKTEELITEYLEKVFKPANITKVRRDFKDKPSTPDPNPPVFKREAYAFFFR